MPGSGHTYGQFRLFCFSISTPVNTLGTESPLNLKVRIQWASADLRLAYTARRIPNANARLYTLAAVFIAIDAIDFTVLKYIGSARLGPSLNRSPTQTVTAGLSAASRLRRPGPRKLARVSGRLGGPPLSLIDSRAVALMPSDSLIFRGFRFIPRVDVELYKSVAASVFCRRRWYRFSPRRRCVEGSNAPSPYVTCALLIDVRVVEESQNSPA